MWIGAANTLLPHIKEGKLKLLGSTAPQRFPNLGDTPAIGEALPGYAVDPWLGLFMPAKVSPEIVKRVSTEVSRVLSSPDVKAKLAPQGIELVTRCVLSKLPADVLGQFEAVSGRDSKCRWTIRQDFLHLSGRRLVRHAVVPGAPCLGPHGQYTPQEYRTYIEPRRQPLHGWGRLKPPGETQMRAQDKRQDSPGIRVHQQDFPRSEEPYELLQISPPWHMHNSTSSVCEMGKRTVTHVQ